MAEYIIGHVINIERFGSLYRDQQINKQWIQHRYRTLKSLTIGLLGFGK